MNIVITTDSYLPRIDGVSRFLSLLVPELAKKAKVTIIAPDFGQLPVQKNVRYIRFPLIERSFGDIKFCRPNKADMKKAIREADAVFNQTIGPIGIASIKISKKLRKPCISYVHSFEWELASQAIGRAQPFIRWCVKFMARRLYNKCTLLIVPSKQIGDVLSMNGITTQQKVVRLGIPTIFKPGNKEAAKKKIGIATNAPVIGYCGRIAREKNLTTLYKAFNKLSAYDAKLLIVGEGLDVPEQDNIVSVGKQANVVPYLQAMDIFVLPSLTETSSLATMEAMATGLPVIVTPVGNIPEYVIDGKNGLLFSRRNTKELAEKLRLLLNNTELREKLGKEARKTILKDYHWNTTAKTLIRILTPSN